MISEISLVRASFPVRILWCIVEESADPVIGHRPFLLFLSLAYSTLLNQTLLRSTEALHRTSSSVNIAVHHFVSSSQSIFVPPLLKNCKGLTHQAKTQKQEVPTKQYS